MKRIFILSLLLSLVSCGASETHHNHVTTQSETHAEKEVEKPKKLEHGFEVIVIDGCEYLLKRYRETSKRGFGYMALKANQSNPDCRCNCNDSIQ
jgi:Tfp pilus assembly protein PilP